MAKHQPYVRPLLLVCLVAACGDDEMTAPARSQLALIPSTTSQELDLLFVIDDSPSTLHLQTSLKAAFPAFVAELGTMPNIHIGVISSDLGTKGFDDAAPGPSIGSGPGSCSGTGKAGVLQTNGTTLVQGSFISDEAAPDGTRVTNYTTTLDEAFNAIVSIGSAGCGFEQPLEAMRLALLAGDSTYFIRRDAPLAVIALQDEDDCSFAHSTLLSPDVQALGPLQSFRCTVHGVTCNGGGTTPAEMSSVGPKTGCHSREDSQYVASASRYRDFLTTYKADVRNIVFATIAGPTEPFAVELRTPPGGGSAIPALMHSCSWQNTNGTTVADPAARMTELTDALPRGQFESVCQTDLVPATRSIARQIRNLLGDTCVPVAIPAGASCIAVDQRADGSETSLSECPGAMTTTRDCYELVGDAACSASGVRVVTHRTSTPSADTMVSLRCTNS
jgi:hypothetical protein